VLPLSLRTSTLRSVDTSGARELDRGISKAPVSADMLYESAAGASLVALAEIDPDHNDSGVPPPHATAEVAVRAATPRHEGRMPRAERRARDPNPAFCQPPPSRCSTVTGDLIGLSDLAG
jgi:hypothetical protein